MRGFKFRWIRPLISGLFGVLGGAVIMTLLYGQKLDGLYLERDALYYQNNHKQKQILLLQQELDKHAEQDARRKENSETIQKILVEVEGPRFGQERIKEEVESILEPFQGKSIHWVTNNPDVLENMLKDRTLQLRDQSNNVSLLQLRLKYIAFIDSHLKVWVSAREISDKDVSLGQK